MLSTIAKVFGAVFLVVGVLGFIPTFTPDGHLLGIFEVDTLHNLIHLASGLAALALGFAGEKTSRLYFQVFGVVYGLVAVLGIFAGDAKLLGLIAHNTADVALHVVIAAAALYLGFVYRSRDDATA